jgi:hypothetical protein
MKSAATIEGRAPTLVDRRDEPVAGGVVSAEALTPRATTTEATMAREALIMAFT